MYDPNKPYTIPQQLEMLKEMIDGQYYSIDISVTTMSSSSIINAINALANNGFKVPRSIYGIKLNVTITGTNAKYTLYYRRSCIDGNNIIQFKTDGLPATIAEDIIIGVYSDGYIMAGNIF